MATTIQSGTVDTARDRLQSLVAQMQRDAEDLQTGLAAELEQATCKDPADARFPHSARLLSARLDNLRATIAQIAQRL